MRIVNLHDMHNCDIPLQRPSGNEAYSDPHLVVPGRCPPPGRRLLHAGVSEVSQWDASGVLHLGDW